MEVATKLMLVLSGMLVSIAKKKSTSSPLLLQNPPRRLDKFKNFMRNSLQVTDETVSTSSPLLSQNPPRRLDKFKNFMRNSLQVTDETVSTSSALLTVIIILTQIGVDCFFFAFS